MYPATKQKITKLVRDSNYSDLDLQVSWGGSRYKMLPTIKLASKMGENTLYILIITVLFHLSTEVITSLLGFPTSFDEIY